jgi:hypothetical protein
MEYCDESTKNDGERLETGTNCTDAFRPSGWKESDRWANILLPMLREAATFTGIGVLAGLSAAFAGAHLASALLFQTSSADPVFICVSVSSLLIIAMSAAVLPASRAASINPVEALRSE